MSNFYYIIYNKRNSLLYQKVRIFCLFFLVLYENISYILFNYFIKLIQFTFNIFSLQRIVFVIILHIKMLILKDSFLKNIQNFNFFIVSELF